MDIQTFFENHRVTILDTYLFKKHHANLEIDRTIVMCLNYRIIRNEQTDTALDVEKSS